MKKTLLIILAIIALIVTASIFIAPKPAHAQVSTNYWKLLANVLQPNIASWTFELPYLGGGGTRCVAVDNSGLFSATACGGGGGGGGSFPFTATTNYGQLVYATSTPTLWFQAGLFASSTSHFVNADFTNSTSTNATSTHFAILGVTNTLLKTTPAGAVVPAISNTDYQVPITFTTTGSSGAATFNGTALNIPVYSFTDTVGNWFTPVAYGNATSTTIGFNLGLLSVGSTTVNGIFHLPLANGQLNINNGAAYSGASTTFSGGLTYTNGNVVNSGVTSLTAGNGISLSGSTGGVTVTNTIGYLFPNNATSTTLTFNNGLVSVGSTTINGQLTLSTTTAGCLNTSSAGVVYAAACASGGTGAYPFTPTTNFGSLAQATTGIPWFQNGLQASSTSQFGQGIFAGSVTGGQFLSTSSSITVPNYSLTTDSDTGIGFDNTNGMYFLGGGTEHFAITASGPGGNYDFGPGSSSSFGPQLLDTNGNDTVPSLYFRGSGYGLWYDGSLEISGGGARLAAFQNGGISFSQPFTVNTGKLSTLNGGFLSTASSTVNGQFAVSTSTQGCASFGVGGVLYSTGTACGTGGGGGSTDFNYLSNFARIMAATTSPIWAQGGLFASSTLVVGTSTYNGLYVDMNSGKVGIGCQNLNSVRWSFGCGTNANINPNINLLVTDPADARSGVAVNNAGVFTKALGQSIYGYDYTAGAPLPLELQEFGNDVGIGTSTPSQILSVQGNTLISGNESVAGFTATGTIDFSILAATNGCLNVTGGIVGSTGTACGSSSGSAFPFTPQTYGNSTTSIIGFVNGLISAGSTTISSLGSGEVASFNGHLYSSPTTTLTAGTNISYSGGTPVIFGSSPITINASASGAGQSPYSWTVAASGGNYTTIQAALTQCGAVGGGNIILTDPSYAQGATGLTWRGSNCAIWGRGPGTTTITFTGATTGFKTNSAVGDFTHDEIHNVILSGDNNASGVAIDWSDMTHGIVDDVQITGFARGLRLNDTQNITFYNSFTNIDMNAISVIGIDASSTNPVNANTFHNIFIGSTVANVIAFQLNNGNGNLADMIFAEPGSLTGTVGLKLFDNKLATNNGVFNNTFSNWYIEANATGVSIPNTVNPAAGGIQRNTLSNITSEANTTDWSVVAGAIALNNFNCNYDSNFGNCLTSEAGPFGIGTSSEILAIGNTPNAMLAVNASSTKALNAVLVGLGTGANTTFFRISNTGTMFAPNTSTNGSAQTGTWCYDTSGQFIRDTATCAVSAARFKQDVNPLPDSLATVMAIKPVTFEWKPDFNQGFENDPNYDGQQVGFIADQVGSVDPRLIEVTTATTTFEDTTYAPGVPETLNDRAMTSVLWSGVQELNAKIDAIKQGSRSVEENWQDILIGLLIVGFVFQQYQIRKLKK